MSSRHAKTPQGKARRGNARQRSKLALSVDMIRCDGHGMCAWLYPDRIWLDRWGYPVVDPAPVEEVDRVRALRAVTACPRAALIATEIPADKPGATVHQ